MNELLILSIFLAFLIGILSGMQIYRTFFKSKEKK